MANASKSTLTAWRKINGIGAWSASKGSDWTRVEYAQGRNGDATTLMEDAPPAGLHSSTSLSQNHARSMDAFPTLSEDANHATKGMISSTTPVNFPTASSPRTASASNATLILSSDQMAPVSQKTSSVIKWTSSVPASNAWIPTTTPKNIKNA